MIFRFLQWTAILSVAQGFLLTTAVCSTNSTTITNFGFTGPEIFPIDAQISQLRVADLDGDGSLDLIVVNSRSNTVSILPGNGADRRLELEGYSKALGD